MAKTTRDIMEAFSEAVLKKIEDCDGETLPWVKPWRTIDSRFRNGVSNRKYRGLYNQLVLSLGDYTDPRWFTFANVRKLGGQVQKGSKATSVIFWKMFKKEEVNPSTGRIEEKTIPYAREYKLFNAEQCDGLNLPDIEPEDFLDDSIKPNDTVMQVVRGLEEECGLDFRLVKSNSAYYKPSEDYVNMPLASQFKEEVGGSDAWGGTTLHELIHWSASRCGHDCSKYSFDIDSRAFEELVAELGSMLLCMTLGVNGVLDEQNLAYIKSWKSAARGKNGERFIYKACKMAEERAKFILENSGFAELLKNDKEKETA